jgi:hypothetical protein
MGFFKYKITNTNETPERDYDGKLDPCAYCGGTSFAVLDSCQVEITRWTGDGGPKYCDFVICA